MDFILTLPYQKDLMQIQFSRISSNYFYHLINFSKLFTNNLLKFSVYSIFTVIGVEINGIFRLK